MKETTQLLKVLQMEKFSYVAGSLLASLVYETNGRPVGKVWGHSDMGGLYVGVFWFSSGVIFGKVILVLGYFHTVALNFIIID